MIKWLDEHLEETFLVICLILIATICFLQAVVRKIPNVPSLQWADEFCRFLWIWSVFISLPYTIRMGNMLRVSVLLDLLPHTLRKTLGLIVDFIVMFCMALFFYYSIDVIFGPKGSIRASGETSPAMQWPMWIVYSFMFIGFGLAAFRGIEMIVIHAKHFKDKELTAIEQTMKDAEEEAKSAKGGEA